MSDYSDLAELVTFRPLERAIDQVGTQYSAFKASWSKTVSLLSKELIAHGAVHAILEIDMREQDIRHDGLPRGDRRAKSSGIVLSFTATAVVDEPQLRYEVATYTDWRDNIRAVGLGLKALRAVDRYGVTRRGEQYAGWKTLTVGSVGIGGSVERGRRLIAAAGGDIKRALSTAHPDHGGDPDDFRDIIAARDSR